MLILLLVNIAACVAFDFVEVCVVGVASKYNPLVDAVVQSP